MDWKQLGESIAKLGLPLLGTAIGGPAGAAIGQLLANAIGERMGGTASSDPDALAGLLAGNAEALKAAKEFELREKQMLLEHNARVFESETKRLEAINATMQAEAKSEHWMQWSWRPFCGFVLGTMVLGCYFVLPLLKITPPVVPTEAWMALGAVLGVASWHRGAAKVRKVK